MNAFHIISTAPFFAKNNGAFALEDFDLFTAVISALEWRKDGSRIFLYCDAPAADYIRNAGLEKVWDGVRDTLPDDLDGIDPEMFWAAGKLLALRQMDAPCVMIDTDLIVWSKPEFGRDIIAAHREDLNPTFTRRWSTFRLRGISCLGSAGRFCRLIRRFSTFRTMISRSSTHRRLSRS